VGADQFLKIGHLPRLRAPFFLAAFAGWNDAGQVATHALTSLVTAWGAERCAEIDCEEFFDFTEARPLISLDPSGGRSLIWPGNVFFAHQLPGTEHDVVVLVGTEPQLRWRTFCGAVIDLADRLDACCLVTLGGFLADVPHTIEPRISGFASSSELFPQLQALRLRVSAYEGPTGITGALHDAWQGADRPAISLWGSVPHYISASPNPQISLSLLERVAVILRTELPLSGLQAQDLAFRTQVEEALRDNPEATDYVRELETHYREEPTPTPPPGPELIAELEEFLRRRRPPEDGL
jgi:proteasome assembly chaperone (PAC2) family protein